MAKSSKRKRAARVEASCKILKTAETVTPPPDLALFQPKSLQTVVSDDELDITVETLNMLAEYPGLIKSKACRDLRGAVHNFRQACTTGVNSVGKLPHVSPIAPFSPLLLFNIRPISCTTAKT